MRWWRGATSPAQAVKAFEYTALASFERAKAEGVARILHLPSLDSLQFERSSAARSAQWPELVGEHDAYFDRKFEQPLRAAGAGRSTSPMSSSPTRRSPRRSHIEAGADPAKVFVVPLAAPPPIAGIAMQ